MSVGHVFFSIPIFVRSQPTSRTSKCSILAEYGKACVGVGRLVVAVRPAPARNSEEVAQRYFFFQLQETQCFPLERSELFANVVYFLEWKKEEQRIAPRGDRWER